MVFPFHLVDEKYKNPPSEKRAYGRRLQESLKSSLGPVLDISRGGLRLISRRPLEGRVELALYTCDGDVDLSAEVRWSKKVGFRKYEVGLQFADIDGATADKLTMISTMHQYAYGKTA